MDALKEQSEETCRNSQPKESAFHSAAMQLKVHE